jgi:hypothetical protein
MATTTNYGWVTPDDTALVKDGAAAIRTLGSSVDTTTKNLNPETTLGDLAYRSSTANVKTRLALGTANQQLRVNSGATAPEWFTPAASGGMTLISETVASAAGTLSLTSIPGTYKHLLLLWNGLYTATTNNVAYSMQFNADSGANYLGVYGGGEGTAAAGWGQNRVAATYCGLNARGWMIYGSYNETGVHQNNGNGSLWIFDYSSTSKVKEYQQISGSYSDDAGGPYGARVTGTYNSTSAITSIDIIRTQAATGTLNNATNTSIRLYGVS